MLPGKNTQGSLEWLQRIEWVPWVWNFLRIRDVSIPGCFSGLQKQETTVQFWSRPRFCLKAKGAVILVLRCLVSSILNSSPEPSIAKTKIELLLRSCRYYQFTFSVWTQMCQNNLLYNVFTLIWSVKCWKPSEEAHYRDWPVNKLWKFSSALFHGKQKSKFRIP